MPRNGSGTYTLPAGNTWNPPTPGSTIDSGATGFVGISSDYASALTQSVSKDGQTIWSGNMNAGGTKITNLAVGTASTDSATVGQIQSSGVNFVSTVGGTADAITLTPSPAIAAYAAGQEFWWLASGTNTTAVTIATSGLAVRAVQANGVALVAGDIVSGRLTGIKDNGTNYQLIASRGVVSHTADYAAGSVTLAKLDTTGAAGTILTSPGSSGAPTWVARQVIQTVNTETGAVATGTTVIPYDDTIPQITEGDQYMTLAITPSSATTHLRIDVTVFGANSNGSNNMTVALFQDATAGALAAGSQTTANTGDPFALTLRHYMTSGTVSATTFRVRVGGSAAGTTTFNGSGGARRFGGVMASSITITEVA